MGEVDSGRGGASLPVCVPSPALTSACCMPCSYAFFLACLLLLPAFAFGCHFHCFLFSVFGFLLRSFVLTVCALAFLLIMVVWYLCVVSINNVSSNLWFIAHLHIDFAYFCTFGV